MVTIGDEHYWVLWDMTRSAFGALICGGSPDYPVEKGRGITGITLVHTTEDYRIFVSGFPEEYLYSNGHTRETQVRLYKVVEVCVAAVSKTYGCSVELFMHLMNRRFIFFISAGNGADVDGVSAELHAGVENAYRTVLGGEFGNLEMVSAITQPISGFGMHVQEAFYDVLYCLDECRFFLKGEGVVCRESVEKKRRGLSEARITVAVSNVASLVNRREGDRAREALHVLFFDLLKPSFSMAACEYATDKLNAVNGFGDALCARKYSFIEELYTEALQRVDRLCGQGEKQLSDEVRAACELISKNYASPLTLEDIASEVGFTKTYLCSKFKAETGATMHSILMSRRMDRAKELLLKSDGTVGEIAALVGIEDANYFRTCFRRCTGLTPSAYRELRNH